MDQDLLADRAATDWPGGRRDGGLCTGIALRGLGYEKVPGTPRSAGADHRVLG